MQMRSQKDLEYAYYRINNLRSKLYYATTVNQISYYCDLLKKELSHIAYLENPRFKGETIISNNNVKQFTIDELKQYNGSNGKQAYVAIDGIVYDVSNEPSWGGASHFKLQAGNDLTEAFMNCHGTIKTLENLPKVGIIKRNDN